MRFAAPRSISPSPVRGSRKPRRRGTSFGVPAADSSSSDSDGGTSSSGESSASSFAASDREVNQSGVLSRTQNRTEAEMRYLEDAIASVRLRTRHTDAYEEWEQETRRDAFRTARREQKEQRQQRREAAERARADELERAMAHQRAQAEQVAAQLRALEAHRTAEEAKLREQGAERNKQLWQRIEASIKHEEERVAERLAKEKKESEERERAKREEVARRAALEKQKMEAEEKRRQAEEEKRRKDEEERKKAKELEEEEKRKVEAEEKAKEEGAQAQEQERRVLGMTTAIEDWRRGRQALLALKSGPMKVVKATRETKSVWSAVRRQITPKIGQVTNDAATINRVSSQIQALIEPSPPHPRDIYIACLSALAKAILRQAETEVTATEKSARPLASVTVNLLSVLPEFAEVLWAKMVQRAGGWPCAGGVPSADVDGSPFADDDARRKVLGYRQGESNAEYGVRVAGIMRVYFEVLKASVTVPLPLDPVFRLPRMWVWTARMAGSPRLLEAAVAPQALFAALDVIGTDAKAIWGKQWIKLLALLYEGATKGFGNAAGGNEERSMGGSTPEGKAARVRVQLEIERIVAAP